MVYKNISNSLIVVILAFQVIGAEAKTVIGDTKNFEKYIKKHNLESKLNLKDNISDMPIKEFNGFADGSVCKRIKENALFTLKNYELVAPADPMFDLFWSIFNIEFNASGNLNITFQATPTGEADKCDLEIKQESEIVNTIKQKLTMKIPDESLTITQPADDEEVCQIVISDALGSLPIFNPEHLPENIDPRWFFCHQYIITITLTRTIQAAHPITIDTYTAVVKLSTFDVCPNPETIADSTILEMCLTALAIVLVP